VEEWGALTTPARYAKHHGLPIAMWCLVRNTQSVLAGGGSLKGHHEKAMQYFNRALKLDRHYLSAWTLMGHEYVEIKNVPMAIGASRASLFPLSWVSPHLSTWGNSTPLHTMWKQLSRVSPRSIRGREGIPGRAERRAARWGGSFFQRLTWMIL
jgi:hypothetical protein